MTEMEIGKVTHYFGHVQVAAIALTGVLKIGDTVRIVGHTTDVRQKVDSMQIENQAVSEAKPGDAIGIKIAERVRPNDKVFKVAVEGGKTEL